AEYAARRCARKGQRLWSLRGRDAASAHGAGRLAISRRRAAARAACYRRLAAAAREPAERAGQAGSQPRRRAAAHERALAAAQSRYQSRPDQQSGSARRSQPHVSAAREHEHHGRSERDRHQHDVERSAAEERGHAALRRRRALLAARRTRPVYAAARAGIRDAHLRLELPNDRSLRKSPSHTECRAFLRAARRDARVAAEHVRLSVPVLVRVGIIGAGAMGTLFGFHLAAGCDVTILDDNETVAGTVEREGLRVNDEPPRKVRVARQARELYDSQMLFLFVKAVDTL